MPDAGSILDGYLASAGAQEPGKEQVSMRLQSFLIGVAKQWAYADNKPYQEVLREWTVKGLVDTLRESLSLHWYFHLLENGKVHVGLEGPHASRYFREEEQGKMAPLRASLDIWFGQGMLGFIHAMASQLGEVSRSAQNALTANKDQLRGSFFHLTRVPILSIVELHANLGKDQGLKAMDSLLDTFQTGAAHWLYKVIEQGKLIEVPEEAERKGRDTVAAADALRSLNLRQTRAGIASLRTNLRSLLEKGIIDKQGNRAPSGSTTAPPRGGTEVV